MTNADQPWPPLIVAEHIPRAVRWRDVLLTLLAWAAFFALLDEEFRLSFGALKAVGLSGPAAGLIWPSHPERLMPFLEASAMLGALLLLFSLRTLVRRARALRLPPPPPLGAAEEASGVGLDEGALAAARSGRIVVVHTSAHGFRIERRV